MVSIYFDRKILIDFDISKYFYYIFLIYFYSTESTVLHTNRELKGNRLKGSEGQFHYTFNRDLRNSATVRKQS